jgi:L-histidine N-alpha-methyltransferase
MVDSITTDTAGTGIPAGEQITIDNRLAAPGPVSDLERDVRAGLSAPFKQLPPKYFYDERGSQLFEQITRLPEYYPTRTEHSILESEAAAIVAAADPQCLVELGSGSAAKTRRLLEAMRSAGSLHTYVPVDISEEITRRTAAELIEEFPGLRVHGVICDFENDLERLPGWGQRRMFAFLGGTIGNFAPDRRVAFLARIASLLGPADTLLLGTDLVKDPARLEAAYDDDAGVTAEFNKNVLAVLNRELGADFDPERFHGEAVWSEERGRMEMFVRSLEPQTVILREIDLTVEFAKGETLRTEISTKFTREGVAAELAAAGMEIQSWWTDEAGDFALCLAQEA